MDGMVPTLRPTTSSTFGISNVDVLSGYHYTVVERVIRGHNMIPSKSA